MIVVQTGEMILYSGHEEEDAHHKKGVALTGLKKNLIFFYLNFFIYFYKIWYIDIYIDVFYKHFQMCSIQIDLGTCLNRG